MPIEIKELIIKATVSTEARRGATTGGSGKKQQKADGEQDNANVQKIASAIMQRIRSKEER